MSDVPAQLAFFAFLLKSYYKESLRARQAEFSIQSLF